MFPRRVSPFLFQSIRLSASFRPVPHPDLPSPPGTRTRPPGRGPAWGPFPTGLLGSDRLSNRDSNSPSVATLFPASRSFSQTSRLSCPSPPDCEPSVAYPRHTCSPRASLALKARVRALSRAVLSRGPAAPGPRREPLPRRLPLAAAILGLRARLTPAAPILGRRGRLAFAAALEGPPAERPLLRRPRRPSSQHPRTAPLHPLGLPDLPPPALRALARTGSSDAVRPQGAGDGPRAEVTLAAATRGWRALRRTRAGPRRRDLGAGRGPERAGIVPSVPNTPRPWARDAPGPRRRGEDAEGRGRPKTLRSAPRRRRRRAGLEDQGASPGVKRLWRNPRAPDVAPDIEALSGTSPHTLLPDLLPEAREAFIFGARVSPHDTDVKGPSRAKCKTFRHDS